MEKISFSVTDISTFSDEGGPVIELYGKTGQEQICVRIRDFKPYFWVKTPCEITDEKITKIEPFKKKVLGKEISASKVYVQNPYDVRSLREGLDYLEADIPFTRRFLIDRKIKPLLRYRAEGKYTEENYKVKVFEAEKIAFESEEIPDLKILSIDIETSAKLDEVVVKGQRPHHHDRPLRKKLQKSPDMETLQQKSGLSGMPEQRSRNA